MEDRVIFSSYLFYIEKLFQSKTYDIKYIKESKNLTQPKKEYM